MAGLLLSLALYAEDPDRVGDIVNIFMFPYLYHSASFKATLVERQWGTALDSSTLTTFVDTASILQSKKVAPIIGWEAAVSML